MPKKGIKRVGKENKTLRTIECRPSLCVGCFASRRTDVSNHSVLWATLITPDQPLVLRAEKSTSKAGAVLCNLRTQRRRRIPRQHHSTIWGDSMARYLVTMPVTGYVTMEVEAADTDAAIHAFWDSEVHPVQPDAWEFTEHVVRGEVCTALQRDVQVRLLSAASISGASANEAPMPQPQRKPSPERFSARCLFSFKPAATSTTKSRAAAPPPRWPAKAALPRPAVHHARVGRPPRPAYRC
jgi:hypothetical protein